MVSARMISKPESQCSPSIEPEWVRVSEACAFARISKPVLYGWLNRGLIKNFSARERGQIKGTRLISLSSLREFLNSRATGGSGGTDSQLGGGAK